MYKTKQVVKILAIDPGTRYMGIAAFENQELIYWAVKTIENRANLNHLLSKTERIINKLTKQYKPDILAQEKPYFVQSKSSENLKKIILLTKQLAKKQNITYLEFAPNTVRNKICNKKRATKKEIAVILASLYPELVVNLHKKKGFRQLYWSHVFDAVALGLYCFLLHTDKDISNF